MQLEELTRLVALKYYQLNMGSRVEILANKHDSLSHCWFPIIPFAMKKN